MYLGDVEANLDRADNSDWTAATTREEAEEALALLDLLRVDRHADASSRALARASSCGTAGSGPGTSMNERSDGGSPAGGAG